MHTIRNQKGMALIFALMISAAIMAMVVGVLYFINQSTTMSGAGKRYATAEEAADGAINVVKDTINLTFWGEPPAAGLFASGNNLATAILTEGVDGTATFLLPSALGGNYQATVTVKRLYSTSLPGGRLEFSRSAGGLSSQAIFYRITSRVTDPSNNTTAENAALYRFAG
jgi:hypothetical protein